MIVELPVKHLPTGVRHIICKLASITTTVYRDDEVVEPLYIFNYKTTRQLFFFIFNYKTSRRWVCTFSTIKQPDNCFFFSITQQPDDEVVHFQLQNNPTMGLYIFNYYIIMSNDTHFVAVFFLHITNLGH